MTEAKLPRLVLVGIDYSPASLRAASFALDLARQVEARVHLIHAWEAPYAPADGSLVAPALPHASHPNLLQMLEQSAQERLSSFVSQLSAEGLQVTSSVQSGDPRTVLLNYTESHPCDWVVLGKRQMSRVAEWFLGNVAAHVVRHSPVPVLVVPTQPTSERAVHD